MSSVFPDSQALSAVIAAANLSPDTVTLLKKLDITGLDKFLESMKGMTDKLSDEDKTKLVATLKELGVPGADIRR